LQNSTGPRVRFAPSPTGFLHVGGARTALYNLLFARREKGTYILRIEDTDVERSRGDVTGQILSAMEWLGLEHDEGPYRQSDRYDLYRAAADRLLAEGKAYRAFETPDELAAERKRAEAEGRSYRYSGAGRDIAPDESDRRARAGEKFVVRLKMPDETIVVDDLIRGRVEFPAEALDDFILLRSDGHPLYHFSVCVDDADMRITHVLRGDDHLANTPKHVALFRALGAEVPAFAHLGMILGTDRKKLSKRYGAAAVEDWRDQGIFPEALVNFLALLGWSPGDDREILTREEMEREFSMDRIGASPSVFDPEKLLWMNAQYMARLPATEILERAKPYAPAGLPPDDAALAAVELHRTRSRTAIEMGRALSTYAADPEEYDADGLRKNVRPETALEIERLISKFETVESWTAHDLDAALRELAAQMKISASRLIHPTRLALTGVTVGAPLFDVVALLGKETALRRLRKFVERIRSGSPATPGPGSPPEGGAGP
jgi:glutamyl-tRNA synthetase